MKVDIKDSETDYLVEAEIQEEQRTNQVDYQNNYLTISVQIRTKSMKKKKITLEKDPAEE